MVKILQGYFYFTSYVKQVSNHVSCTCHYLIALNTSTAPLESIKASRDHRTPNDLWHQLLSSSVCTLTCVIDAEGCSLNKECWCHLNQWVSSHQLQYS